MIFWDDTGIVVKIIPHKSHSAIVYLLTQHHGLFSGYVKTATSKKHNNIWSLGNIIHVSWESRLEDQMGQFINPNCGFSVLPYIIQDKKKLYAIKNICLLYNIALAERNKSAKSFESFVQFIKKLPSDNWLKYFFITKLDILRELGTPLQLDYCAVTGKKENLTHISPKTGRIVCEKIANQYKNQLIPCPIFLKDNKNKLENNCIKKSFYLFEYFEKKSIPENKYRQCLFTASQIQN